ncbi:uncharacterized protein LOC124135923 [Haliotis rufescens]|uniref:uncharacterized protein LOC124135923 n=1 Tax=Haliotis rufescens TaxID=6454 RepID=UPI00201EFB14|nr:uncharacterized protein LOC124135923 [Haliotis rufescens]
MKSVISFFILCIASIGAELSLRQTDPGGQVHVPDTSNPVFSLDQRNDVVAIVTKSGCYLYHLTDEEVLSAANPGGVDDMDHVLISELKSAKHFLVVANNEYHHLSHDIRAACQQGTTYDINDVKIGS